MPSTTVLVVGATGSIGRLVVEEALRAGFNVRTLVRDPGKSRLLPQAAEIVAGDVTRPETLGPAVAAISAVVFTLGSDGADKSGAETLDYGGVRNVLRAIGSSRVRIALMTSIGVTNRLSDYNRRSEAHDWKRRSERLVRASNGKHVLLADLRCENADAAAKVLSDAGFDVSTASTDMSSRAAVQALAKQAAAIGDVTGLIHAAGISPSQAPPAAILAVDKRVRPTQIQASRFANL